MRHRRPPPPPIERVATVAQRLAVLLGAGVAPSSALAHVRETDDDAVLEAAVAAAEAGGDVAVAICRAAASEPAADAWQAVAAAWSVSSAVGAPLASTLRTMAESFRDVGRLQRELVVALAGPRATARLVALLPVVAVGFGVLLGFDTLRVLFATPIGIGCLVSGVILLLAGSRWSAVMVARASRQPALPGLALDLTAIALAGGTSIPRARAAVDASGIVAGTLDGTRIDAVLELAGRAGIPAGELLRSEADQQRLEARSAGQERAARLGVTLMVPLALCVLPAFMLLGVAPMLISVVSSTRLEF